jgi:hypothetical protein
MAKAAERRVLPPTVESSRERERLRTVVFPEHGDLAVAVADRIIEIIQRETRQGPRRARLQPQAAHPWASTKADPPARGG